MSDENKNIDDIEVKEVDYDALDNILKEVGEEGIAREEKVYIYKPIRTEHEWKMTEAPHLKEDISKTDEKLKKKEDLWEEEEKLETAITDTKEDSNELPDEISYKPIEKTEEDKYVNEIFLDLDKRINWEEVKQEDEESHFEEVETTDEYLIEDDKIPELDFVRPIKEDKVSDKYNEDLTSKETKSSLYEEFSDIMHDIEDIEIENVELTNGDKKKVDTKLVEEENENLIDEIDVVSSDALELEDEIDEEPKDDISDLESAFDVGEEDIIDTSKEILEDEMPSETDEGEEDELIVGEPEFTSDEEKSEEKEEKKTVSDEIEVVDSSDVSIGDDSFDFDKESSEETDDIPVIDTEDTDLFGTSEDLDITNEDEEISSGIIDEVGGNKLPEDSEDIEMRPEEDEELSGEEVISEDKAIEEESEGSTDFDSLESAEDETKVDTFTDENGMESLSDDSHLTDLFPDDSDSEVFDEFASEEKIDEETDFETASSEESNLDVGEEEALTTDETPGFDEFGFPDEEEEEIPAKDMDDLSLSTDSLSKEADEDVFDDTSFPEVSEEEETSISDEIDSTISTDTDFETETEETKEIEEVEEIEETVPVESESIELSEEEFEKVKNRLEDLPEPTASEAKDVIVNDRLNNIDMRKLINILIKERPYTEVQNFLDKKFGKKKKTIKTTLPIGLYIFISTILILAIVYLSLLLFAGIDPIGSLFYGLEGRNYIDKGLYILNTEGKPELIDLTDNEAKTPSELFNEAIKRNPNDEKYYNDYADIYLRRNEPEKALDKLLGKKKTEEIIKKIEMGN